MTTVFQERPDELRGEILQDPAAIEAISLTVEHFSERLGCTIRGSDRTIPPNIEFSGMMNPGIYVTVYIHGNSAAGSTGETSKLRSHSLCALAFREPTSRTAMTGTVPAIALGVCMEYDQLSRFGLQSLLDGIFVDGGTMREVQVAADFRTIHQAWQILQSDTAEPLDLLRLEAHALDILLKGIELLQVPKAGKEHQRRERLLSLCDTIEADLSRQWTMADFAREAGMSVRSLSTKFAAEFQRTPFEFLRERRLQRARDSLVNGELRIADVARLVGYASTAHFCTAYKSHFGVAPGASRLELTAG